MAGSEIKAGRAVVEVSLRDKIGKGLVAIERKLAQTGRNVATLGAALSAGSLATIAWPLKLAADMERTSVSFEVFTGDAKTAQALMEEMKVFAINTPFGFNEVAEAGKLLMQYGIKAKNVIPMLKLLGDVSQGDATKMHLLALGFGQIVSRGKLTGDNLKQLTENGFNPLYRMGEDLAKQFGGIADNYMPKLQTAMEDGKISVADVTKAFISATSAGGLFYNSMDKQAKTGIGLLSKLLEIATNRAIEFGTIVLDMLKPSLETAIGIFKGLSKVIKENSGWLTLVAKIAVGFLVAGGALIAIGGAAFAVSTIFGSLALVWGAVVGALSLVFTPLGIVATLLTAVGVAAFTFRGQIASAFNGIAGFFAPLTNAIGRVYEVFSVTFGAIIQALISGQLTQAAAIAWLGFVATAWAAVGALGGAIEAGFDMFGKWALGIDNFSAFVGGAFRSIGQALLSSRWDLAGSIVMAQLNLEVFKGLSAISLAFDLCNMGILQSFDTVATTLKGMWRDVAYAVAKTLAMMLPEKYIQGQLAQLDSMYKEEQRTDNEAADSRARERVAKIMTNGLEANRMEGEILKKRQMLDVEAAKAAEQSGIGSIGDLSAKSREELDKVIRAAEEERNKAFKKPDMKIDLPSIGAATNQQMKVESRGTFSAAAAALFGNGGTDDIPRQSFAQLQLIATRMKSINDKIARGGVV